MDASELRRKQKEFLFPNVSTYYEEAVVLESGKGLTLKDVEGREYLDFFGGILTVGVGHCHPRVTEAVIAQQKKLVHVSTLYPTVPQIELAEKLNQLRPTKEPVKSFFTNSGTEANETAVQLAKVATGRCRARSPVSSTPTRLTATAATSASSIPTAAWPAPRTSRTSSRRRPRARSPASSPSRSWAWADSSCRPRSTSKSPCPSCATPAACSSPTRCRRRGAAPAKNGGACSTSTSNPTSSPAPRAWATASPSRSPWRARRWPTKASTTPSLPSAADRPAWRRRWRLSA